jgi:hypothetical protein
MFRFEPHEEGDRRASQETLETSRQFTHTLPRILAFLGVTIDDVARDAELRERVYRAYKAARRIERHLDADRAQREGERSAS